ncbi:MAG: M20/M25/M40 family metallo-hydrolase [Pyrinomonadaceae bacterium]|nr:M20/M25/M40 family metallo-hydrolase [Pyrinomonadaceae bacterium]
MKSAWAFALLTALLFQTVAANPVEKNAAVNAKIRDEAMKNSQIMRTLHFFTDVYGPRLTGSPKLVKAGEWAMKQMDEWGFDKTEMDPWEWGNEGWENERASGFLVSPVKDSLVFEVLAWTPSTNGVIKAEAVQLKFPSGPRTQSNLDKYFAEWKDKVKGKIVVFGNPRKIPVNFKPPGKRLDEETIKARFEGRPRRPRPRPAATPEPAERPLSFREILSQMDKFFVENGALLRINDAGMGHGMIRAFSNRSFDSSTVVPTVVMRNEDFGRITRLMADGNKVELEFNIKNKIYPEGKTQYNVIGEIKGTDKADEVIMLGGHLDSWHAATGATDNGIGCAVMMEAARILKAIDVKPRRTIRVALWSGEEQGLLGSQAYVEKHFGSAENPKPAYYKFGGYFNIDSGTGRARGMSVFGPKEAASILGESTKPFVDLNFVGVANTTSRRLGGSDHTSFNRAGLPGIGVLQDPIEYFTHTWHTNLDTYERIVEEDVKASATVIAAAVYELAMRDELLPRLSKEEMPKLAGSRQ